MLVSCVTLSEELRYRTAMYLCILYIRIYRSTFCFGGWANQNDTLSLKAAWEDGGISHFLQSDKK